MIEDAIAALRSFVRDSTAIMDLLAESADVTDGDGRVWTPARRVLRNQIPEPLIASSDTFHPPKILVLRQGGGPAATDELPIETERVLVLCYGESQFQADRLRRAVFDLFKYAGRVKFENVLLHHLNKAGGPVPLADPDIVWPAVSQAFTYTADLEDAA